MLVLRSSRPTCRVHTPVRLCNSRNTLGAEMSWEEGLAMLQDHPDPSVADYNTVIRCCAKAGKSC